MKRVLLLSFLAGSVVACSEASRTESDLPSAPGVLAAPPVAGPCSFRDARTFAGNYFSLQANKRTAADLLRAAEDAAVGSQARNDIFFQVFQLIETARNENNVASFADGAKLILEADDCGSFDFSHPGNLQAVLTEALTDGAFAYRNGSEGFVATEDGGSALYTANWNTWVGSRSMVIGAQLLPFGFGEQVVTGFGYRWQLLYDSGITLFPNGNDDLASVELCDFDADELPQYRVGRVKASGAQTILQQEGADIAGFCNDPAPTSILGRAIQKVVGFFAPTPLQAFVLAPPGMAGGIGELSDFIGADAEVVVVDTLSSPQNGTVNNPITFTVEVLGGGGTPLENVGFIVTVEGNQGTNVALTGGCPNSNELGQSLCSFSLNKTGGYQVRVTANLTGYAPAFIVTKLFNLQQ